MLAKNQKLSFVIELLSLELLESYPHPCYFELIFNSTSQTSKPIPSPTLQNPLLIALSSKFSFEIPLNQSQETPQQIQIKLRETCNKKKLAFNQLDLKLLHLPYHEWTPLSNKSGLQARLLINIVYSTSISESPNEEIQEITAKPLLLGRGTSWIETKPKEFRLDNYRKKAYLFGDDENPLIVSFDFTTESLEVIETPDNLQLMGYSMAAGIPNGKIIITGGINHNLNIIVPTAYCYDPIRNRAEVLSSMLQARYTHNLIYKDQYVYALGGRYYGKGAEGVLNKCERLNLNTNVWSFIASLNKKRCTSVCYIHENFIYIVAGYEGATRLNSIERYNDVSDVWETCSMSLESPIEAGCGCMVSENEGVYIGGQSDVSKTEKIVLCDFKNNSCKEVGKMNKGRVLAHTALYQEKLYVFGGLDYDWEKIDIMTWKAEIIGSYQGIIKNELKNFASCVSSDYFDEKLDFSNKLLIFGFKDTILQLEITKNLLEKKPIPSNLKLNEEKAVCLMPNGYLLIAGGVDNLGFANKKSYLYNAENNICFIGASMVNGKWSHGLLHYYGFIYSIGGFVKGKKPTNLCERYNIKANKWEEIEGLNEKRAKPLLFLYENSVFCFGGIGENKSITSIEKYEIQEDSWKLLEVNMPFSTPEMTFFMIKNELFLVNTKLSQIFSFNLKENSIKIPQLPSDFFDKFSETSFFFTTNDKVLSFSAKNSELLLQSFDISSESFIPTIFSTFPIDPMNPLTTQMQILPTLTTHKIFSYIDEISLSQDIERESRLLIFMSKNTENSILEFNMKTESFEINNIAILEKPMAFFKHSKATGLPDGKILITGGLYSSEIGVSVVNSALIYNPFNKSVKLTNPMNIFRFQHAVTGSNRFVYALGGKKFYSSAKEGVLNSCERYDIREGCWEEIPAMEEALFNCSACIIDKNLYVFGGNNGKNMSKSIQILDKIKLFWSKAEVELPKGIENMGVLALGYHEIFLCGGNIEECSINDVYLFDIAQEKLQNLPSMQHTRTNPKIAAFGKNIYVLGGNSVFSSEKTWISNPLKLKWETLSSYNHLISDDLIDLSYGISRMDLDSLKIDHYSESFEGNHQNSSQISFDKLYIFGNEGFPYILRLKLPSLVWEKLPKPEALPLWDYSIAVTLPNGNIMITGGINNSLSDIKKTVSLIVISNDNFQIKEQPNLLHGRYTHTMCYLNNYVYALGGRYFGAGINGVLSHCERFNLITKEWKEIGSLNMRSCTATATNFLNKVYIFGGYRGDGRNKHIERYNELKNIWENVPLLLNNPIEAEVLIPLSGHEFLMLGGKDDFKEQKYVIVYDLERGCVRKEKEMLYARILCKAAKFNEVIYVVGGQSEKKCEMAKVGEWEWKEFEGYEKLIDAGLEKTSLVKNAFAQSV